MKSGRKWTLGVLGLLATVMASGLIRPGVEFTLGNGGRVRLTEATFWRCFFSGARSTVFYQPQNGPSGSVVFWQYLGREPVAVWAGKNSNELLCLYDEVNDLYLVRVSTDRPFESLDKGNEVGRIVAACTWDVEQGRADDWQEVLGRLHAAPSGRVPADSGLLGNPGELLKRLERQHIR